MTPSLYSKYQAITFAPRLDLTEYLDICINLEMYKEIVNTTLLNTQIEEKVRKKIDTTQERVPN